MKKHKYETFGLMLDMSRNGVMTIDALKRFLPLMSKFGYNALFLYTEDTYEIPEEPYFGYMRGRYTKEELRELDEFAASLGIEVIPCIQTLAHLTTFLSRWGTCPSDTSDILMVDDERTYKLIDSMFRTLAECFKSRRIHLGMDEAHMLGRGEHLDKYGYEENFSIMKRHLTKVTELAIKHGFDEPMIWSDMLIRGWNGGAYGRNVKVTPDTIVPKEYKDALPKQVAPVFWDYYNIDGKVYDDMLGLHKKLSDNTWFAGGVWSWFGFVPYNAHSIRTMLPAMDACRKHKIKNVFMTMWGDGGAECSFFALLPSLLYIAEYARGNTDEAKIKAKFKRIVGIDFDRFMLIDEPNNLVGDEHLQRGIRSPSKYMFYSDCLMDFLDYKVIPGAGKKYSQLSPELHAIAGSSRRYGYVFDTVAKLCDVMAIKYELGLKTRRAYEAGDRDELRRLANDEYAKLPKLIRSFRYSLEKRWYLENKSTGFEVHELRLGGLETRISSVRRRILAYCDGKLNKIEELECELLPYEKNLNSFSLVSTVNVM